jgi:hypothetical protein
VSFDLHTHSNRSDGVYPPRDVVRFASEAGLAGIALTDHDSLEGYDEALFAGTEMGLEVLCGVELSTIHHGGSVHMLGLFLDPHDELLHDQLRRLRDDRIDRAQRMVARLNDLGVPVTWERVREIAHGESVGRPHIADAMIEAGVISKREQAFTEEWIAHGGRAYVERHTLTPLEGVAVIRQAGGAPVLAHPIWTAREESLAVEDIEDLVDAGLIGLEVDHPDHDREARAFYGAMAARLGLVPTGASDWHGDEHGGKIGTERTDPERVEELRERAGRR